jgi:adenylyltransferase/sulfurtransferase
MDVEAGKVTHFNGLNNHMHTTAYAPDEDCESHWTYGEITELPLRAETNTMQDLMAIVKSELGPDAVVETDQELVISLSCSVCNTEEKVLKPMSEVSFEAAHCPTCGEMREVVMSHLITGEEDYLHHTLFNLGIPPLHIVRANNGDEYRFYELTGDLADSLHFSDFSEHERRPNTDGGSGRVRLGDAVADTPQKQAKTKTIRLLD